MKLLVVGSGGREHALAWKLAQSPQAEKIYVAPGNAGTALTPNLENIAIAANDINGLIKFAQKAAIDLTVIGPEAPLAEGVVDIFHEKDLAVFGPSKACAQLEVSKTFSKAFMQEHHIPTAFYQTFTDAKKAISYIQRQGAPIVVKADGLTAGKGVVVAKTETEAIATIHAMLTENKFGDAGKRIVIEEYLEGEELSFIAMIDGKTIVPMATSQDHKARDDDDKGPNTGGMGAYSPASIATPDIEAFIMQHVMQPVVDGMAKKGTPYTGFLYAGLMLTQAGPKVLEFNCRFGDPETQPIIMRLQSDFVELCRLGSTQRLKQATVKWDPRPALGVVMASRHYPETFPQGDGISGLEHALENVRVFHAGTTMKNGKVVTAGGRVLCVTAMADTLVQAQQRAYYLAQRIHWGCEFYRTDIGNKSLLKTAAKHTN